MRFAIISAFLISLCASLPAATVDLTLLSGEVHSGRLIREDATAVTISVVSRSRTGTLLTAEVTHQRAKIAKITEVPAITDQYAARWSAAGTSPAALGKLAVWCLHNTLHEDAIAHARDAWMREPGQSEAEHVLTRTGHIRVAGEWVVESTHLATRGEVRYRNEVLPREEAARRKGIDDAKALLIGAREQVGDLEGRERKALRGIAEETARRTTGEADARKAELFLAENRPRVGVLEDRIRSAKSFHDQTVAYRFAQEGLYGPGHALPGSYHSEHAAKVALEAEQRAHQVLLAELARASTSHAAALRIMTEAQEEIAGYQKTLERSRTALIDARAKVADLERRAGLAGATPHSR